MPDALSKTVPIWCAVVNRANELHELPSSPSQHTVNSNLHTPPMCVSKQEHVQIEGLIEAWARDLAVSHFPTTYLLGCFNLWCRIHRMIYQHSANHFVPSG